jgi:hypothetical protein
MIRRRRLMSESGRYPEWTIAGPLATPTTSIGQLEQTLEHLGPLGPGLLPCLWLEDLAKAGSVDPVDEGVAGPGDDECLVVSVKGDLFECRGEVCVRLACEHDRAAVRMEAQHEHAVVILGERQVLVLLEVGRGTHDVGLSHLNQVGRIGNRASGATQQLLAQKQSGFRIEHAVPLAYRR